MVRKYYLMLATACLLACADLSAQCSYPVTPVTTNLFVKATPTGTGDGSSWDNAFDGRYLAKFLREMAVDGTKIYVAAGTYLPYLVGCDNPANIRTYTFDIKKNIEFRGGYDPASTGTELIANYDPKNFVTRLSGEVQPDADATNNCYHVVTIEKNMSPVIDGFYISGGYADNTIISGAENGGGILDFGGQNAIVRFSNLIVENNAANYGGAIYFDGNLATVGSNLIIRNNTAFKQGAIFAWGDFGLFNSTITSTQGAGIVSWGGDILLRNVTISGNSGNGVVVNNVRSDEIRINIVGATITNNTSAGISLKNNAANMLVFTLVNSLVVNNAGSTDVDKNIVSVEDFPISAPSIRHNIVGDSLFILNRATRIKLPVPVALGPLAANGGWGDTHELLNPCTNPAVNTGDPQLLSEPFTSGLDQRGVARSNPPCIGAYDGVNGMLLTTDVSPATLVCNGGSASLTVNAILPGTPISVTYQWKKDGSPLGGQTNSELLLNNVQPTDAGKYTVEVTRDGSCVRESDTIVLSVKPAPTVVLPSNQTVCGGTATTAVSFTGSMPQTTFTWTNDHPEIGLPASGTGNLPAFNAVNTMGSPITATIMVVPSSDGCTGVGQSFTITVSSQPAFVLNATASVCEGATEATLSYASPNETSLSYTITFSAASLTAGFQNIPTTALQPSPIMISVPAALPAGSYGGQLILQNVTGCQSIAYPFTITMLGQTKISNVLRSNVIVCEGAAFALAAIATGANLQYQWFKDGQPIAGATKAAYLVHQSKVENAGTYYVVVTGTCGTVQSGNARVWINRPDWLLQKWSDVLIVDNTCNCVVGYQWIKNGALIVGATNQFYSEEGGLNGTYYALITLDDGSKFLTCEWSVYPDSMVGDIAAKIYPNPIGSNGSLTINLGENAGGEHTVELYDLSGRLRKQAKLSGSVLDFSVGVPQGTYLLRIATDKGTVVRKIIVQ